MVKEPLLISTGLFSVLVIGAAYVLDLPNEMAATIFATLSVATAVAARTLTVPRRVLMEITRDRDEVREATLLAKQEEDNWRAFYSEMSRVVAAQQNVIESLKAKGVDMPDQPDPMAVLRKRTGGKASDHQIEAKKSKGKAALIPQQWRMEEALSSSIERPKVASKDPKDCDHPKAVKVEISTGEVVAKWCPDCSTQITDPEWMEQDLVDEEKRLIRDAEPVPPEVRASTRRRLGLPSEHAMPTLCNLCDEPQSFHTDAAHQFVHPEDCSNCGGPHHWRTCPYPS